MTVNMREPRAIPKRVSCTEDKALWEAVLLSDREGAALSFQYMFVTQTLCQIGHLGY